MKIASVHHAVLLLLFVAVRTSTGSPEDSGAPIRNPTQYEVFVQQTLAVPEDLKRQHAERILRAERGEMGRSRRGGRVLADTGMKFGLSAPPLSSGPSMAVVNMSFYRWESVAPPPVVDWRKSVAITPIQTQFVCASCWAIAAVDSVAMMWAVANNATASSLSPQQVCDCATKQCCQGGWPDWAFSYVLNNGGITSNKNYPYQAYDSATCLLDTSMPSVAQITGWELVPAFNAMALMKAVSMQPVVAFISASTSDFAMYKSRDVLRIYDGVCLTEVNHAVVVVGFNYTGPDLKGSYWIIKNSWYTTWGDRGYMYLAMTPDVRGKCGILSIPAMYPVYYPSGPQPARFCSDTRGKWNINKVDDLSSSLFSSALSTDSSSTTTLTTSTTITTSSTIVMLASVTGTSTDASSLLINSTTKSASQITALNPGLNCDSPLLVGSYVCVAPKSSDTTINCTGWYRVMQGDTCPSIWNGANLTMSMFQAINPGIQCQAPYLVVGQQVCIDSPVLTTMQRAPNTSYSIYTVRPNDTLSTISSLFLPRCTPTSVSPESIAAQNYISDLSAPLAPGTKLIIPCIGRIGMVDCGCAASIPVCGSDFVSYPSYCDALCNFALPALPDSFCTGACGPACQGRMGLAPVPNSGCTNAICPYPSWAPAESIDCAKVVDTSSGPCCSYRENTCKQQCTLTAAGLGGTVAQRNSSYNDCYSQCMCCQATGCGGATCKAPSACWNARPRKCVFVNYSYVWNCTWFPAGNPLP
ncbi:unnamed protein product [Closterium sp. NIES-64]|nr:unnamed protein product [Closterium sp. NIES-64]